MVRITWVDYFVWLVQQRSDFSFILICDDLERRFEPVSVVYTVDWKVTAGLCGMINWLNTLEMARQLKVCNCFGDIRAPVGRAHDHERRANTI